MRYFICIDLPKEVQNELAKVQQELPKDSKLVLVKPKDIHLTIKFLGEIDEEKAEKVKELLKKLNFTKFKAKIGQTGVFPTPSFIRVIWMGIEPKEEFEKIHGIVDKLLSLENFKLDGEWQNHATLARVKFIQDKSGFIDTLKRIKIKPIEFVVDNLKLKKSTLTPEGPVYEELLSLKFN